MSGQGGRLVPVTRSRGMRRAFAIGAVLLSVGFHVGLLLNLPSLPGMALIREALFPDYRAIELGSVQVNPASEQETPRFRPENPAELAALFGAPDGANLAPLEIPAPQLTETSLGDVQGENEALATPDAVPEETAAWDPREEILRIEEAVFDEAVSALPRRLEPAIDRRPRAPDIVPPTESSVELARLLDDPGPPGIESASRPTLDVFREAIGTSTGLLVRGRAGDGWAGGFERETGGFGVPTDEPDAEAIEDALAMRTRVYESPDEPGVRYFELVLERNGPERLPVIPKDVLLLQDCSESMTPWKLADCKRGLRRWLDAVGPEDRFNIVAFSDSVRSCFDGWSPMGVSSKAAALAFIDAMRAEGNTDVYASLEAALGAARDPGRPLLVVLVSDGRPTTGVTETSRIIVDFTTRNGGRVSVFALGGGERVNRFLLDLLSYRNRGDSRVVPDADQIPNAMIEWAAETKRPVLTDLEFRVTGLSGEDVFPETLTHLYLDRPLTLYGKCSPDAGPMAIRIAGVSGATPMDIVFPIDLSAAVRGDGAIRTRWAWHRIYHGIARHLKTQDERLLEDIRAIAARYGLVLPYGYGGSLPKW